MLTPCFSQGQVDTDKRNSLTPVTLVSEAKIDFTEITETSGIVKSRLWQNVFWVHNDSGDEARIFAINALGNVIVPEWAKSNYQGISIAGAANVDWEDICTDHQGNLYLADCGNNDNLRRDLTIYVIKEPSPTTTSVTSVFKKFNFYYPEQDSFPPTKKNFDCEAIYYKDDSIYLLTKHRSDKNTSLYKLDSPELFFDNPAVLIDEFPIDGRVTGADCSPEGKKLAILTYKSIWLFELADNSENFFKGKISYLSFDAKDCEGICFDENDLIVVSEPGSIYRIPLNDLRLIRD